MNFASIERENTISYKPSNLMSPSPSKFTNRSGSQGRNSASVRSGSARSRMARQKILKPVLKKAPLGPSQSQNLSGCKVKANTMTQTLRTIQSMLQGLDQ